MPEGVNAAHGGASWAASTRLCWRWCTCARTRRCPSSRRGSGSPPRPPGYVDETLEVLASWAPGLQEALVGLGEGDFVIVDGTLIPLDRVAADQPYYSQKHRKHGMNVQVVARPDGTPLWLSRATPGRTHDLTAARAHGIVRPASPGRSSYSPTAPTRAPAPPSAPRTTTTANNPSPTSSSTATTHDSEPPANAPSPNSRRGGYCNEPAVPPAASAQQSKPSTLC
jgi:hypothetical protein